MQNFPFYFVFKLYATVHVHDNSRHIVSYLPFILFTRSFPIIDWRSIFF